MKTIYFDCYCGISGDMSVGALIDAGADFEAIRAAIASLPIEGYKLQADKIQKKGIQATQFRVLLDEQHHQPHRHLRHVVEIIEQGQLPEPVRAGAIETFRLLAEAEAAVHGTTIEKVHFHEVGAIDAIVDIVGAQMGLHLLGIEQAWASPLHVGAGTVHCEHGVMPVPAPATARLLQGVPTYGGEIQMELVTPTGAALARQSVSHFGGAPPMTVHAIGYGSGTRDLPDRANVLRVLVGEMAESLPDLEPVTVMEANVDDMTGELIPPLLTALLDQGARDAFVTPVLGKKGRPAYCVTALCDQNRVKDVAQALLANSTTIGLRMREERRIVLERSWRRAETPWGPVRVKLAFFDGARSSAAPEFEDCRKLATEAAVPVRRVYEAALAAALRGDLEDD